MEAGNGKKSNGYKIRSWSDLASISSVVGSILIVAVACILWGLKLESELNVERALNIKQASEIAELKAVIRQGILPRADEQNKHQEEEIRELKSRVNRLEDKH